jgi:tRNA nucleotidyltransferase (CCA-adding enzyme)
VTAPKPGKPVVTAATILEDLRRRDFTANAMALSLNQGSYGLLMDPLNGVADIENRELRLVSNYGFIESPVHMIRAARFAARLGWQMEEKTLARYETGKAEGYISAMGEFHRGYEAEEIVHEEDPLRVMRRLESEGWMKLLAPAWTSAKANVPELEKLREAQMNLQTQGIHADSSAAQFPLLTAKLALKDVTALKKIFPRKGFVAEIEALEGEAKKFAAELGAKPAATASGAWKLLMSARPEAVLWVAYSTKSAPLKAKFESFYKDWPQARQKIPYVLMQEMRIVPELPGYDELVDKLFFELMDGKLGTVEEMKAFLEPYSPPAPPPPVNLRRARAAKKEPKAKSRKKADAAEGLAEAAEAALAAEVIAALGEGVLEEHMGGGPIVAKAKPAASGKTVVAKVAAAAKVVAPAKAVPVKAAVKVAAKATPVKAAVKAAGAKAPAKKAAPVKTVAKKAAPVKAAAKKVAPVKAAAKKTSAKVVKAAAKPAAGKAKAKVAAKPPVKAAGKTVTKASAKAPGKKVAAKKAAPVKAAAKKKR